MGEVAGLFNIGFTMNGLLPLEHKFGLIVLPVKIGLAYLVTTFILFLVWPINWLIYDAESWIVIIGYVSLCFASLGLSFWFASNLTPKYFAPSNWWKWIIPTGAIFAILLLFPQSYVYTDRWPWEVFEALSDQGKSYSTLQEQLLLTEDDRLPVVIIRFFIAPLIFAVLPLGVIKWNELTNQLRILVVLTALSIVIFSILRGTDREFADLFIIICSSLLVVAGRRSVQSVNNKNYIRRYWKPALAVVVFISLAGSLFIDRKSDRVGGYETRTAVCANESRVCADIDAPGISWLPLSQRFGLSFFILSTTSGYYGLSLALEKDFEPTYFVGHSPASLAIYELVSGDSQMATRTYTYRNAYDGWSEENYWSSLVTWIANDVGFAGAIFVLLLLGFGWGRSWIAATKSDNDAAAILFTQFMLMIFYLPANNQVFAAYEGYSIFFFWLFMWIWQPRLNKN